MLEDRDYMRQPSDGQMVSATVVLLVTNIVVFLLKLTVLPPLIAFHYLPLSLDGLRHGFVWQLLSFQFLHAGWVHLIFNSLGLYFFGRPVELALGRIRFLQVYFVSGIVGGLMQMLLALAWPHLFDGPVVGASAGVSGLLAAFAVIHWDRQFTLLVYFFPVTLRGRTMLWFSIGMALLGIATAGLDRSSDHKVAHAAHLGGLVAGFLFVRLGLAMRSSSWSWQPLKSRQRKRELVKAASIKTPRWPRSTPQVQAELPEEEFISREVDPILDKISAHGIQSLTERERRILEAARKRMAKR